MPSSQMMRLLALAEARGIDPGSGPRRVSGSTARHQRPSYSPGHTHDPVRDRSALLRALAPQMIGAQVRPPAPPLTRNQLRDPETTQGPIGWGGRRFGTPEQVVDWMNARGAGTTIDRFYGNHPLLAALFGQRGALPTAGRPARPMMSPLLSARAAPRRRPRYQMPMRQAMPY